MKNTLLTGFLVLTGLFASAQKVKHYYRTADTIRNIDSNGSWDYCTVDEETNKLYISHGTIVQVINLTTSKVIAMIPNTNGVHGIALANELNKGFISDGQDNAVTVFDMKTNATITKVKITGEKPDAIIYDNVTKRVFTFNGKTNNASVLDAKTNKVIGTIALGGKPEFSVADGKGKLFVNLEDSNAIAEIDASSMKVLKQWSIKPGHSPSGLAIDKKTRRLFSACDNHMMVISDADNGKVVTTVEIGDSPDAAAFDPDKMMIFTSNGGDATMTVVKEESPDKYTVLENTVTQRFARTMAVNTKTHHIYLPAAEFNPVHPVSAGRPKQKRTPKAGTFVVLDVVPVE